MRSRIDELMTKVMNLESQLASADALARAAEMAYAYFGENIRISPSQIAAALADALAAYEKVREIK